MIWQRFYSPVDALCCDFTMHTLLTDIGERYTYKQVLVLCSMYLLTHTYDMNFIIGKTGRQRRSRRRRRRCRFFLSFFFFL